jgi:hypothetical protein
VKFAWIAMEKAYFPVSALCRNLRVTTAGEHQSDVDVSCGDG